MSDIEETPTDEVPNESPESDGSRPTSSKSQSGSRPATGAGSRPATGAGSRPASGSRPQTVVGSRPGTGSGSRPVTGAPSRPETAKSILSRQGSARSTKSAKSVAWSTTDDKADLLSNAEEGDRKGCCNKLVSGMWASREMLKDNTDQHLYVKITLRELILYTIFMFVICYATFTQYSSMNFIFTKKLKTLFERQMDVTNMNKFWDFTENEMLDGLYWETWYNRGYKNAKINCPDGSPATQPCPVPPRDRNVLYENRILGLPRIRQLKVHHESCWIPPDFSKAIKVCYGHYSSGDEDRKPFPPAFRKYSSEEAWVYQSAEQTESASHWGKITTYGGGGNTQTLHYLKNESLAIIQELKEGLWVTQGTRFVSIDFTVYNVNINLFCVVKLSFEFPPSGGVIPSQQFTTVKLIKYAGEGSYFLLAIELIFVLYILYYIVEESLEIKAHKFKYFSNIWNILDLIVIGISAAQIFLNLYMLNRKGTLLQGLLDKPFQFADFSYLAKYSSQLTIASAFNVFVAWIKVFKYLSFNKTMTQLSETLSAAAKDLSGFSVMFFIIYFAFVQLGYLLFGTQVRDFSTFNDAFFTLFRMILGDFNFRDIENANTFLGPAFFLSYIFFVFFVLLNMFLAIINDTYADVKAEVKARKPDFQMGDFFKTGANNMKSYMGIHDRAVDVENAIKLAAADDGYVTYDELRENLRKARFSDVEIDLFFHHFQNDPVISQIILDEEDLKAKQLQEEKRKMSLFDSSDEDEEDMQRKQEEEDESLRPKSGKQARQMRSARIRSALNPEENMVPDDDFYDLQDRIVRMERSIGPLTSKLDIVLARLDAVAKTHNSNKKVSKSTMESMFDQIIANDGDDALKFAEMKKFAEGMTKSRPGTSGQ